MNFLKYTKRHLINFYIYIQHKHISSKVKGVQLYSKLEKPALSTTADIIPVTAVYQDNIISLISPDKLHSFIRHHNDTIVQQLSGSDSDDRDNFVPSHSLSPFYSVTQLRSMKFEVQHVS